jgi:hypothetical protein
MHEITIGHARKRKGVQPDIDKETKRTLGLGCRAGRRENAEHAPWRPKLTRKSSEHLRVLVLRRRQRRGGGGLRHAYFDVNCAIAQPSNAEGNSHEAKGEVREMTLPVDDLGGKCGDEVNGASFQNTKWDSNNNNICIVRAAVRRDDDANAAAHHTAHCNGCADIKTLL